MCNIVPLNTFCVGCLVLYKVNVMRLYERASDTKIVVTFYNFYTNFFYRESGRNVNLMSSVTKHSLITTRVYVGKLAIHFQQIVT